MEVASQGDFPGGDVEEAAAALEMFVFLLNEMLVFKVFEVLVLLCCCFEFSGF